MHASQSVVRRAQSTLEPLFEKYAALDRSPTAMGSLNTINHKEWLAFVRVRGARVRGRAPLQSLTPLPSFRTWA